MHFKLTRTGGFAGISPPPVELDTTMLSKKNRQFLETMVAGANFFDLPKMFQTAKVHRNRFQYSLSIVQDDGHSHTVTCDEDAAPEPLRQLLHTVQYLKRK